MTAFPSYMQMPRRLPVRAWHPLRALTLGGALGLCVLLLVEPDDGLFVLWKLVIPLLPILWFVAPGLWRNICPLAASNQTPRLLGFTRGGHAPRWLQQHGFLIGATLFIVAVANRQPLFNGSGPASAALVFGALAGAFTGGYLLKGKSGWCSSICPLLPVQRIYGQTPFAKVPNSHCQPCVGCTKNCYDFNPQVALLADLHDGDAAFAGYRKLFVGAFPGIVVAFFNMPAHLSVLDQYGRFGLYVLVSVGSFAVLDGVLGVSTPKLTALYGGAALNLFYWYGFPRFVQAVSGDPAPDAVVWPARVLLAGLTLVWLWRTYEKEAVFLREATGPPEMAVGGTGSRAMSRHQLSRAADPEVTFVPDGTTVVARPGLSLLEIAEGNGMQIEAGCRMGVCGADPVAVIEGMDNLSPMSDDERNTLARLGLADNTRMACCARVAGPVAMSLKPQRPKRPTSSQILGFRFDESIEHVVVIGNGIAGVTAADHVRRRHPACTVDIVADESHHLYNRMGIERLIYGRSAMQGLNLLEDNWWDDYEITTWLNTRATTIDRGACEVGLATGERLPYDRLILATGSRARRPEVRGFGVPGTFALRSADDALGIRAFAQRAGARRAVVAGGGLLGLEAAYALHRLGLRVTVLERFPRLLGRQLDERASALLRRYLEGLGLEVVTDAEAAEVFAASPSMAGEGGIHRLDSAAELMPTRVSGVVLDSGRTLTAELFLVCAGITPNTGIARRAGLEVRQGVVVDDHMRTSDPRIFAAGDCAEHRGVTYGLWPTAVEQGEVAADNATGGDKSYEGYVPVTVLKVVGIELTSIGRIEPEAGDEAIVLEDPDEDRYRKLVVEGDRLVGAILLGYSQEASLVATAVKRGLDVGPLLPALRAGDWSALEAVAGEAPDPVAPAPV